MTIAQAERINGWKYCKTVNEPGRMWIAARLDSDPPACLMCAGDNESEILKALVEMVYRYNREIVLTRAAGKCENCGAKGSLEVDHITARSKGRNDRIENLRALGSEMSCGCHRLRHTAKGGL